MMKTVIGALILKTYSFTLLHNSLDIAILMDRMTKD
jgi:hypothetical protein